MFRTTICFIACLLFAGIASANVGTRACTLLLQDGSEPDDATFIVYIADPFNPDDFKRYIITEDTYNASLEAEGNGGICGTCNPFRMFYDFSPLQPFGAIAGQDYTLEAFSPDGTLYATLTEAIPSGFTFDCDLRFGASVGRPGPLQGSVVGQADPSGVASLQWDPAVGATAYYIYTNSLPCGAVDDACRRERSSGIYAKLAETTSTFFNLTLTPGSEDNWFIVVPVNASGDFGPHSEEVRLRAVAPSPTPQPTETPTSMPTPTSTPTPSNTPTPTATATNTPTPSPTPCDRSVSVELSTGSNFVGLSHLPNGADTASDLATLVATDGGAVLRIAKLTRRGWVSYIPALDTPDFCLEQADGVLVEVEADLTWTYSYNPCEPQPTCP